MLQLHGVTFEWRDPKSHGGNTARQTGFIAQEVEKVMPQWVGADKDGYKTITTDGLEALLVESIRTLKTENDTLKDRVKSLESKRSISTSGIGETIFGVLGAMTMAIGLFVTNRRRTSPSL